jgi:hypothetical protein
MIAMTHPRSTRFRGRPRIVTTALLALSALAVSTAAQAADSWTVSISEKQQKLVHDDPSDPDFMMWDKWLMWDIGYERMICRNMPFLELTNDSTSLNPISEFRITIGDNRFNFGPVVDGGDSAILGSTTPGFDFSASTASGGDELIVNIGNGGLLPGEVVRFQIKLDVDPSFAAQYSALFGASRPDFRTVLFDMNGVNVYDNNVVNKSSADNAQAFVVFNPGGQSLIQAFEDFDVAAGQYYNSNLREYTAMDPVLIFEIGGELIPEPGSAALAMMGLATLLLGRLRSRR